MAKRARNKRASATRSSSRSTPRSSSSDTGRTPSPDTGRTPRWGGARPGAGRPKRGARASEPHKTRPAIAARYAIAISARLVDTVGARVAGARTLDSSRARELLQRPLDLALARDDFRIVHLAIRRGAKRSTALELIVEANDTLALARGMQGFQVSAARSFNRALRRRGNVFVDRYRARVLASRAALAAAIERLPRSARVRLGVPQSPLWA